MYVGGDDSRLPDVSCAWGVLLGENIVRETRIGQRADFSFPGSSVRPGIGEASGFDDVGELEYRAGDGQDDVDLLGCRARIALEVDAAVDGLVGWDRDCLQVRCRRGEFERFLGCSLSRSIEFGGSWIRIWIHQRGVGAGVRGGPGCGWEVLELRGWDVEEDPGPGGEGLDTEVFRGEIDGDDTRDPLEKHRSSRSFFCANNAGIVEIGLIIDEVDRLTAGICVRLISGYPRSRQSAPPTFSSDSYIVGQAGSYQLAANVTSRTYPLTAKA
jgi:hypothetical protein